MNDDASPDAARTKTIKISAQPNGNRFSPIVGVVVPFSAFFKATELSSPKLPGIFRRTRSGLPSPTCRSYSLGECRLPVSHLPASTEKEPLPS